MKKSIMLGLGVCTLALGGVAALVGQKGAVETNAFAYSDIFLKGDMNGWTPTDSSHVFKYIGTVGDYYTYQTTAVFTAANQTFKVHDDEHDDKWVNSWDASGIVEGLLVDDGTNEHNIKCTAAGTYTITYKYKTDDSDYKITGFEATSPSSTDQMHEWCVDFLASTKTICSDNGATDHKEELEPIWTDDAGTTSVYTLKGTFDSWGSGVTMKQVGTSSVYRASNVFFPKGGQFKVNDGGEGWWPASNYTITKSGYYKIEFDRAADKGNGAVKSVDLFDYLSDSYARLPAGAKDLFTATSDDAQVRDAFARYVQIVTRYSLLDFAEKADAPASKQVAPIINSDGNGNISLGIIAGASALTVGIGAGLFLLKKKKAE